jgi:acyl-CoA thioesterase I
MSFSITGDSLVLAGAQPGRLCFSGLSPASVQVRNTYWPGQTETRVYEAGRDYVLDAQEGTLARTSDSRIPDYRQHVLYGVDRFDHTRYPEYGNHAYFAWVDYVTTDGEPLAAPSDQAPLLARTAARLRAGATVKVIAYGDSITVGGEASVEALRYQNRWVAELAARYPQASVVLENGATGGDRSHEGVARLEEKVLARAPHLVLVAYGMNDVATPIPTFEGNLNTIIRRIREDTGAEVLLLSAFPPNPRWVYSSGNAPELAAATRRVAVGARAAYADVYGVWDKVLRRKDLPSLLGNNINHPNDFGHWLYYLALRAVGL